MFGNQNILSLYQPETQISDIINQGLIPHSISRLFQKTEDKKFTYYCSFLQIYNENLYDLLQDAKRDKNLKIRENKIYGIFVEGLAEFVTENEQDCFLLLSKGDKNRAVRQTRFNHHSSRSHTIFQMLIESDKVNKRGVLKKAKVNFCDLAGSEKFDKENNMFAEHIKELTQINKSLSTLGKVIYALGTGKLTHVPYRDSKLTRLLQDSLGVNTRTILIATISPAKQYADESINTLKFADRAKQVMVKIKKNEVSATNDQLITKLQREIQHLKTLLNLKRKGGIQELEQKIWMLTEENHKLKSIKETFTAEEVEKLKQENKKLRIELQQFGLQGSIEGFYTQGNEDFSPISSTPNKISTPMKTIEDFSKPSNSKPDFFYGAPSRFPSDIVMSEKHLYNKEPQSYNSYGFISSSPNERNLKRSTERKKSTAGAFKRSPTYRSPDSSLINMDTSSFRTPNLQKKMNVRYKMTNYIVEDGGINSEIKEAEARKKEMYSIKSRLNKIAEIEMHRKEQFKKEIRMLEENRKKDEEDSRKKSLEDIRKRKKFDEKKKIVDQFKKMKKNQEELEQMKIQELKREAESKRKIENEYKKGKVLDYYSKQQKLIEELKRQEDI